MQNRFRIWRDLYILHLVDYHVFETECKILPKLMKGEHFICGISYIQSRSHNDIRVSPGSFAGGRSSLDVNVNLLEPVAFPPVYSIKGIFVLVASGCHGGGLPRDVKAVSSLNLNLSISLTEN